MRATLRRKTWFAVCISTAATLLAGGCGDSETPDSETAAVHAAVGAYFRAIDAAAGAGICSHLTDQTRRAVAQLQETSCQKALTDEARRLPAALNGYDVTDVSVDGGRATVALKEGATGAEEHMTLKRIASRWKITDAPGLGQ